MATPRKRRLKSEFAFFQTPSRLFQLAYFVKCKKSLLEPNSGNRIQVYKEKENFVVGC